ncbi:MAG: phage terminase large subunit [Alphaproteobacteria bacterium]|nr:phage terminase large subunit [Alphaproteobacteria bacterium]
MTRLSTVSAHIEAGYVRFPKQAPWLNEFLLEILQFPATRHDDQVDSMTQLLGWVREKRGAAVGVIKLKGW